MWAFVSNGVPAHGLFSSLCDAFLSYNSSRFISSILSFFTYSWTSPSGLVVCHVCLQRAQHIHGILTSHFALVSFQFGLCLFPHLILNKRFLAFFNLRDFFRKRTMSMSFAFPQSLIKYFVFMGPRQKCLSTWVKLD